MIPACNTTTIPWLPHLYGETRFVVTGIARSEYAGCLELDPTHINCHAKGSLYGYPFDLEVHDGGQEIRIRGLSGTDMKDRIDDPPAIFRRIDSADTTLC